VAFRIHDSVVRGEIDNREKGVVRGLIWVHGRSAPIRIELKGNAHSDIAGCLLKFENPLPTTPHPGLDSLHPLQRGTIGDLTASRKVRVFDLPFEEACAMINRGEKPPEHTANSVYLEWFSEANGRVVIESTDYTVDISPPLWGLTPTENEQRAKEAAGGMADTRSRKTSKTGTSSTTKSPCARATPLRTSTWNCFKNTETRRRRRRSSPKKWVGTRTRRIPANPENGTRMKSTGSAPKSRRIRPNRTL
jgi:hypothetical protein